MTLDQYQLQAHSTAVYTEVCKAGMPSLTYAALGLAGEAGEFCNKVKKAIRDDASELTPERREQLKKELGGVLWYLAECCSVIGFSLGSVAECNLNELADRKKRGVIRGEGDNR